MTYKRLVPLILLGVLGAGGWRWWMEQPAQAKLPASDPPAISVDTAATARQNVPIYLSGLGTVQALNTVTVTPRVDGQLQKVAFLEGQDVKEGDLLAQIDPRPFQAALDQAIAKKAQDAAQLENAQRDLQRFQALSQNQFASKQQLDTGRAQVSQLQAAVEGDQAAIDNARTQLDYTAIRAPLYGRTGFRLVDQGNNVHASDTAGIVVITQLHPISVIFTLPEDDLPAMSKAMAVGSIDATALARDGKTVLDRGKVVLADNEIDQATGTARFKAVFANNDNTLWPGAFVNLWVLLQTRQNALTIPSAAVERGPDGFFAYVVKPDATVEPRPIKVGVDTGQLAIVDDGLNSGDQVVTDGQYRLQPGARVQAKQVASNHPPANDPTAHDPTGQPTKPRG